MDLPFSASSLRLAKPTNNIAEHDQAIWQAAIIQRYMNQATEFCKKHAPNDLEKCRSILLVPIFHMLESQEGDWHDTCARRTMVSLRQVILGQPRAGCQSLQDEIDTVASSEYSWVDLIRKAKTVGQPILEAADDAQAAIDEVLEEDANNTELAVLIDTFAASDCWIFATEQEHSHVTGVSDRLQTAWMEMTQDLTDLQRECEPRFGRIAAAYDSVHVSALDNAELLIKWRVSVLHSDEDAYPTPVPLQAWVAEQRAAEHWVPADGVKVAHAHFNASLAALCENPNFNDWNSVEREDGQQFFLNLSQLQGTMRHWKDVLDEIEKLLAQLDCSLDELLALNDPDLREQVKALLRNGSGALDKLLESWGSLGEVLQPAGIQTMKRTFEDAVVAVYTWVELGVKALIDEFQNEALDTFDDSLNPATFASIQNRADSVISSEDDLHCRLKTIAAHTREKQAEQVALNCLTVLNLPDEVHQLHLKACFSDFKADMASSRVELSKTDPLPLQLSTYQNLAAPPEVLEVLTTVLEPCRFVGDAVATLNGRWER